MNFWGMGKNKRERERERELEGERGGGVVMGFHGRLVHSVAHSVTGHIDHTVNHIINYVHVIPAVGACNFRQIFQLISGHIKHF